MTTLNLQIVDGLDDGYVYNVPSLVLTGISNSDVANFVGNDDTAFGVTALFYPYWRFVSVTIPQGATINSATLGLTQLAALAYGTANATIYGNNVNNAAQPTAYADIVSMAQTTANTVANIAAAATKSYNVATIIQEIVNRGGWVSGNALMLAIFPDTGSLNLSDGWSTYDNGSDIPTLDIDYTAGGGVVNSKMFRMF